MKPLLLLILSSASTASAACPTDNVVTYGATMDALGSNGRPLITIEGAGVTIERRGHTGSFSVRNECDPEDAAALRRELQPLIAQPTHIVPNWLDR